LLRTNSLGYLRGVIDSDSILDGVPNPLDVSRIRGMRCKGRRVD